MADRGRKTTGHNTIWRCDGEECRMVADIYDRDAATAYRDLLNVLSAGEGSEVRFKVVLDAGLWKDPPVPEALQRHG